MAKYFVVSRCEDEPMFAEYSRQQLLDLIKESDGEYTYLDSSCDLEYFPVASMLIIKGKVVKPQAIQIATEYDVE